MKAVFSPGPSYLSPEVRKYAGWVRILDLYKVALEELGYEVFIPKVDPKLIDQSSTVSKILSYDIVAASQLPEEVDLFLGPPGYSLAQVMKLRGHSDTTSSFKAGANSRVFLYIWNNSDNWRDAQLREEYTKFGRRYDTSPTWRWINRTALEMSDWVIACSPWVKKTHSEIVREEKILMALWGVDSTTFTPAEKPLPTDGVMRILFVGGDPIRKGLIYLLQGLPRDMERVELWIAGCAPLQEEPYRIKQLGMVPHNQMPELYQSCHALVLPSLEDGVALCVQEAMASGLVAVTSPETGEVFEDGESGIVVPYRDVDAIARAILLLRDNPAIREQIGHKARALAITQTWETTKQQFKEAILRGLH